MSEPEPLGTRAAGADVAGADTVAEFSAFYRSFVAPLVGFLVWQGAPAAVAAELAQETMVEAYRSWSAIEYPQAWARRVASRKLVRHISRVEEAPVNPVPEAGALVSSCDALAEWESRQTLRALLDRLPPRQRQILAWSVTGHAPAQIAVELGIDPATVRANLMKARRSAARFLASREEDA